MAFYEIRTLITRHRTSLISFAEFPSDLAAILAARALMRRGETLEIWRGDTLVYRIGPAVEWNRSAVRQKVATANRQQSVAVASPSPARRGTTLKKRAQALLAALGLFPSKSGL